MKTLEPVRNETPAPLEARTDGAAVAGGDLLLTGRGFLTGWRESEAIQRESRRKNDQRPSAAAAIAAFLAVVYALTKVVKAAGNTGGAG